MREQIAKQLSQTKKTARQRYRNEPVEAIEEKEFRETGKIANIVKPGREVSASCDPPNVTPEKTMLMGRVDITRFVGVTMVMAMMRSPPEGTALYCRVAQDSEDKLAHARSLERSVREVAMVEARHRKHPYDVEC
jgi:hypothetical protein